MAKILEGTSSFSGDYRIKIWHRVIQLSQSVENNASTIRVQLWLGTDDAYTSASRWGITNSIPITVEGQTKNLTLGDFSFSNSWWSIGSIDFTIPHNSDGAKIISFSYSCNVGSPGGYNIGSTSFSTNFYPDTIPRASTISGVSGLYLGSSTTVLISRKAAGFTHQVWYRINGGNWVEVGSGGHGTKAVFTIPQSSGSATGMKNTLDVCIRTKSGDTTIGADVYSNGWTITMPSYSPSAGSLSVIDTNAKVVQVAGKFIQSQSSYKITVSGAAGKYGSTIKSYQIFFNGVLIGRSSSVNLGQTKDKGIVAVKAEVIDSRGMKASVGLNINIEAYNPPRINAFLALRTGGGTNKKINLSIAGNVSPLTMADGSANRYSITVRSSPAGKRQWSDTFLAAGTQSNITVSALANLDYDLTEAFDFSCIIADRLTARSSIITVGTTKVVMALGKTNVGVGRIPDDAYAADVDGVIRANGLRLHGISNAVTSTAPEYVYHKFAVGDKNVGYVGAWPTYLRLRNYKSGKSLDLQDDGYLRYDGPAWFDDLWIGNKKLGDMGDYLWGTGGQGVALNGSNWKTHRTLTITKGTWIIDCGYNVDGQSGKYLSYRVSGVPNIALGGELYCQDGYEHISTASAVVTVSASATLTLQAWTSNGMTAVKNHYLQATKITG